MVVALIAVVTACGGGAANSDSDAGTTTTTPSTTTTSEAPTTTTAPTPTTTLDEWDSIKAWVAGGAAGEYRTNRFEPAFKFTIPSGWWATTPETPNRLEMAASAGINPDLVVIKLREGGTEETLSYLIERSGLDPDPVEETMIGNASAVRFTARCAELVNFTTAVTCIPGGMVSVHIVDISGDVITIFLLGSSENRFEDLQEEARAILDSIVWKDLS